MHLKFYVPYVLLATYKKPFLMANYSLDLVAISQDAKKDTEGATLAI